MVADCMCVRMSSVARLVEERTSGFSLLHACSVFFVFFESNRVCINVHLRSLEQLNNETTFKTMATVNNNSVVKTPTVAQVEAYAHTFAMEELPRLGGRGMSLAVLVPTLCNATFDQIADAYRHLIGFLDDAELQRLRNVVADVVKSICWHRVEQVPSVQPQHCLQHHQAMGGQQMQQPMVAQQPMVTQQPMMPQQPRGYVQGHMMMAHQQQHHQLQQQGPTEDAAHANYLIAQRVKAETAENEARMRHEKEAAKRDCDLRCLRAERKCIALMADGDFCGRLAKDGAVTCGRKAHINQFR